jgi:hypothetical protein
MRPTLRILLLSCLSLPLVGCPADEADSTTDASSSGGRGSTGGERDDLPSDGADAGSTSDSGSAATDTSQGGRDIGGSMSDTGATANPDASGGGACNASSLDEAIQCQVRANRDYVDVYCDCLTDTVYEGDRAACVSEQPGDGDFQPDSCARAALMRDEAASVANSACYAAAVNQLAACVGSCPVEDAGYSACFSALNTAFDACDTALPTVVTDALSACSSGEVTPPAGVSEATVRLVRERDAYIGQYCACAAGSEYPDVATCRTALEGIYDPGLTSCEQGVFAAQEMAALPFIGCLADTYTIAATACMDCPTPIDFEYELCTDPGVDINFCFAEAPAALQDALIGCSR